MIKKNPKSRPLGVIFPSAKTFFPAAPTRHYAKEHALHANGISCIPSLSSAYGFSWVLLELQSGGPVEDVIGSDRLIIIVLEKSYKGSSTPEKHSEARHFVAIGPSRKKKKRNLRITHNGVLDSQSAAATEVQIPVYSPRLPASTTITTSIIPIMTSEESGPSKPIFSRPPYQLTPEEVAQELETNVDTGLSPVQAGQAFSKYGSNELDGGEGVPIWKVFVKQISNAMYVPCMCMPLTLSKY